MYITCKACTCCQFVNLLLFTARKKRFAAVCTLYEIETLYNVAAKLLSLVKSKDFYLGTKWPIMLDRADIDINRSMPFGQPIPFNFCSLPFCLNKKKIHIISKRRIWRRVLSKIPVFSIKHFVQFDIAIEVNWCAVLRLTYLAISTSYAGKWASLYQNKSKNLISINLKKMEKKAWKV